MSKSPSVSRDLQDSENDKKHLKPEKTTLDLPDVKDIPGQENVRPPRLEEMADTTVSSADEEGDALFGNDETDNGDNISEDVTPVEKRLLRESARRTADDEEETDTRRAALDAFDEDGDPLNEGNLRTDRFGVDLDLPESEEVGDEDSAD